MVTAHKSTSVDEQCAYECYNWHKEHTLSPKGYTSDVDERFFGPDTPNKPPAIDVEIKLATNIQITDDDGLVSSVAEFWIPEEPDRYTEVAKVAFNDLSVWHIPLPPWEKDHSNFRMMLVDEFIPDIVQWKALNQGQSPSERLESWKKWLESDDYTWEDEVSDTEMSDSDRQWFNENLDNIKHLDRQVDSSCDYSNIEIDDIDSWENGW